MTGAESNETRAAGRTTRGLRGLHRQALVGAEPAGTVKNLFADLRLVRSGEFVGEDVARHLQGSRVIIDRDEGHGSCDLYRLDPDVYVVATDTTYDSPRFESVPGEGLLELHLRLSGVLDMTLPGRMEPFKVVAPCLLMMYQPVGLDACERVAPNRRDVAVSLFCKPEYIARFLCRNSIEHWPVLDEIEEHNSDGRIWHRTFALSPGLLDVANSLLQNRYVHGLRLLYAEAKSLELICEVLSAVPSTVADGTRALADSEIRQLEGARQLLLGHLAIPLRVSGIAKAVGMSQSNLKRRFKTRYGMTVFEYGVDCRMRHALHLLRSSRLSVEQVANEAGYRHQTSFSSAFRNHFGFLPKSVRRALS